MDTQLVVLIVQIVIMVLQAVLAYLQTKNAIEIRLLAERLNP
jgi:uncharacterized integral membrane protein